MATTTGQALRQQQEHPAVILQRQYSGRLASLVPSHVNGEAWVRQATGTLRDPKLAEAAKADFGSFVAAVERAAVLGLRPGTEEYYLIPRKIRNGLQIQGIIGYQGLVDLMYRSGAVASVVVEVVRKADRFSYSPGRDQRPVHEIDWDLEDRGPLRLAYSYAEMTGGAVSKVIVLNQRQIYDNHRARSEGYEVSVWKNGRRTGERQVNPHSPWVEFEESMWLKTLARQLSKWVPTSTEYISQRAQADVVATSVVQRAAEAPSATPVPAPVPAAALPAGADTAIDYSTGELLDDPNTQWDNLDSTPDAETPADGAKP